MKNIKLFEEYIDLFKKEKYVKFNNKCIGIKSELEDEVFKIESFSEHTNQVWTTSLKTGEQYWISLKNLRVLTELELNTIKYNL
jgi:hypothetical protein